MGEIWIVNFSNNSQQFIDEELLKNLPESTVNRALRYLNKESFLSFITGRLLLKKAISESEYSSFSIENITYSDKGKPSFTNVNFSISHSNGYVVLIFGTVFQVGIDIEKRKDIDLKLFKYLFTDLEWSDIKEDNNPLDRFYWYWVRKEALLKAVGCSLKEIKKLFVFEKHGIYNNERFYFEVFNFHSDYNGIVAMEKELFLKVRCVELEELLN